MSTTYRRRSMSEAEREQRRNAERERVKEAAEQLLTSEGWQRWVRARSMFRRYSAHNTMLLALDFHLRGIDPEPVAGFRVWLKLGRCVRKGEHGIRISARVTPKKAEPGAEQTEPQLDKRPVRFTTVAVFGRLSRVRSGDVVTSGREIRYRSVSRLLLLVRAPPGTREGTGFGLRGRRGAGARRATAQRRSRARLAGDPSANKGAMNRRRECRHRVPQPESRGPRARPPKAAAFHEMEPGDRLGRSWLVFSDTSSLRAERSGGRFSGRPVSTPPDEKSSNRGFGQSPHVDRGHIPPDPLATPSRRWRAAQRQG